MSEKSPVDVATDDIAAASAPSTAPVMAPAMASKLALASSITKDEREYLAYQVAEKAREQVAAWAKWIITPIAIVVALLGANTYHDLESKITTRVDDEIKRSQDQSRKALERFNVEKDKELADFKQQMQKERDAVHQVATQVTEQMTLWAGNVTASAIGGSAGSGPAPDAAAFAAIDVCLFDAGQGQTLPGRKIGCTRETTLAGWTAKSRAMAADIQRAAAFLQVTMRLTDKSAHATVTATIHYGKAYNNAFWNGTQVVIGDGDGTLFRSLADPEIYAHELALRDLQQLSRLRSFSGEEGALLYHIADVASVLYTQSTLGQLPGQADWLIGKRIVAPASGYVALRSMRGGADKVLAQAVTHTRDLKPGGDAHFGLGIPNTAFYRFATKLDRFAWQQPWLVWRAAILQLPEKPSFAVFAQRTLAAAEKQFGATSAEVAALKEAWQSVGVTQ